MKTKKSKVLVVTRNFPPLIGGMERLLHNIFIQLKTRFDVKLIGPDGCVEYSGAHTLYTLPYFPIWNFLISSILKTFAGVMKYRPSLIISGSGITVPAVRLSGLIFNTPVLTYLHGLDLVAPNYLYRLFFLPIIRSCDGIIVNSSYTKKLALANGITPEKIHVLNPGTDNSPLQISQTERLKFRQTLNAINKPILLSVGRLTKRKGIIEFVDNCMGNLIEAIPEILLIIIGGEAKNAIAPCSGMIERLYTIINKNNYSKHISIMGEVDDTTLQQAYASCDLLVFPVLEKTGDVEGFGMVAIEAASNGLPTVAFSVGGVTDAVKDRMSGLLIEPNDYVNFTEAIIKIVKRKADDIQPDSCKQFSQQFSWPVFGKKLFRICQGYIR